MKTIIVEPENNLVVFRYTVHQEFDPDILVNAMDAYRQLIPTIELTTVLIGYIPLELSSYVLEVSKYCSGGHIIKVSDSDTFKFLTLSKEIFNNPEEKTEEYINIPAELIHIPFEDLKEEWIKDEE